MKSSNNLRVAALLAALLLSGPSAKANLEVSASVSIHATADFYAPLAARGAWVEVGTYGRCWRPAGVVVGWRPYCDGYWVWTDCGWYWESDEPWAWACYHYGWWVLDPVYGWVWVPGVEWAPAWVVWRSGGGYIGWAPLPPHGAKVVVAGPEFVFVETRQFQARVRPSTVIVNNSTILSRTSLLSGPKQETRSVGGTRPQTVMVNEGPGPNLIEGATGKRLKAVPIREAAQRTAVPSALSTQSRDSAIREKPSAAPAEAPRTGPPSKLTPGGQGELPDASGPGETQRETGKAPAKDRFAPPPGTPTPHGNPPPSQPSPSPGKHEGHGKE